VDIKTTLKASVAAGALLALVAPIAPAEAGGALNASNSKIDTKFGGRIHRAIRHVDDGQHDGLFHTGGASGNSEIWFSGSGALTENVTVGAYMRWDIEKNQHTISFGSTTGDDTSAAAVFGSKYEYIYFKHKAMGTLTVGDYDEAAGGTTNFAYGAQFNGGGGGVAGGGFAFTTGAAGALSGVTVGAVFDDADPTTTNVVRWDLPAFGGLSAAVSLSQADQVSGKLTYVGKMGGLDMTVKAGYSNSSASQTIGGSAGVSHASGLHLSGGYGSINNDDPTTAAGVEAGVTDPTYTRVMGGYTAKLNSMGATDFNVHWHQTEDKNTKGDDAEDLTIAAIQTLDAIGGKIGLTYSRIELTDLAGTDYNDVDVVYFETSFNF